MILIFSILFFQNQLLAKQLTTETFIGRSAQKTRTARWHKRPRLKPTPTDQQTSIRMSTLISSMHFNAKSFRQRMLQRHAIAPKIPQKNVVSMVTSGVKLPWKQIVFIWIFSCYQVYRSLLHNIFFIALDINLASWDKVKKNAEAAC